MSEAVLVALITGSVSVLAVIITSISANRKMQSQLEKSQLVTDTKLEALTREVREHNSFARRVPVLEAQMKAAEHRLNNLEQKMGG